MPEKRHIVRSALQNLITTLTISQKMSMFAIYLCGEWMFTAAWPVSLVIIALASLDNAA